MDDKNGNWSIQGVWNDLVTEDWKIKPRDYIRASEVGKPYLDRYLAMKGVQPTNPFPARVKRIFDCGLIFEDAVERIFRLLGILIDSQTEVKVEEPGMLPVIGHYDQLVGGKINEEQALAAIDSPETPLWMKNRATKLLKEMLKTYPDGLQVLIAEIKSVNSMAFWAHKNIDPQTGFFRGYDHHKLQLYSYLKSSEQEQGRLFYVSKDDLTLMESGVFLKNEQLAELWNKDISDMTRIMKENKEPEKPADIVWDEHKKVWTYNWMVSRSSYFTLITGKETVEDWENSLKAQLKEKNTMDCKGCKKPFMLQTLNKNKGFCLKCHKLNLAKENVKGGEKNE